MTPRCCPRCRQTTYPDSWCDCDPWDQVDQFFSQLCVELAALGPVKPPDDLQQRYAEVLLSAKPPRPDLVH